MVMNILLFRYVEDMGLYNYLLIKHQLQNSLQVDDQNAHELTENWIYIPLELDNLLLQGGSIPGIAHRVPEPSTLPGARVIQHQ